MEKCKAHLWLELGSFFVSSDKKKGDLLAHISECTRCGKKKRILLWSGGHVC